MDSQRTGLFVMIASAFALVVFFWAVLRRSYMAIALPLMGAVGAVSALAFWIGWTMYTGAEDDEEAEEDNSE